MDVFCLFIKVTTHRKHEEVRAGSITTSRASLGGSRAASHGYGVVAINALHASQEAQKNF